MSDTDETERRIRRQIVSATVRHMSNTKWHQFFAAFHSVSNPLGDVGIKFINDDRVFKGPTPGPHFADYDNFGECGGISHALFAHIEFVQIPHTYYRELDGPRYPPTEFKNDLTAVVAKLGKIGSYPIQNYEGGIRILGYEWAEQH